MERSFKISFKWISNYLFMWAMMIIPFMFVKKITGVLRPHFLDLCKPNVVDCQIGTLIRNYECTNNLSLKKSEEIFQSFPSGHASLATYFSIFLIIYVHQKLKTRSKFLVPLIQGILIFWIAICCSSRISDNAHHAFDVLFGILIGLAYAIFTVSQYS